MTKFNTKKPLGQNFLTDQKTIENLVLQIEASPFESIVEIGAGLGAITNKIIQIYPENKIYSIEIDPEAIEILTKNMGNNKKCQIIFADAINWMENAQLNHDFKIIGSLPYYITSPIVHSIVKMKKVPLTVSLLIQHEVAEKICSLTPKASYFSTFVNTFFDTVYVQKVNRQHFEPSPNVDSAIIKMAKKKDQPIAQNHIRTYEKFLHRGFQQPRKMVNKVFTSDELKIVNIQGNLRAQEIGIEKWVEMFNKLVIKES